MTFFTKGQAFLLGLGIGAFFTTASSAYEQSQIERSFSLNLAIGSINVGYGGENFSIGLSLGQYMSFLGEGLSVTDVSTSGVGTR